MKDLLTGLVRAAGFFNLKDVEIFPKQGAISRLGNLVALPFQGPDKMRAGASMFYDPDTLFPLVNTRSEEETLRGVYQLLLEMKRERNTPEELKEAYTRLEAEGHIIDRPKKAPAQRTMKGVELDRRFTPSAGAFVPRPVAAVFKGCEALRRLQQIGLGHAQGEGRHGLRYQQRLFLAGVIRGLPGGREAIHEIIRGGCSDYDPTITDGYINSLNGGPWLCATAQKYPRKEHPVCPFCALCPAISALNIGYNPNCPSGRVFY